ncbi:hypothetical protein ABZ635_26030 [Nocardiopsis sp. NPDC007018]|uniref:hypothetical protein n=1 Tax=Nocardiopsis sp. NPDC007018 TaxID=3155721 RepID=UPI0033DFADC0
MDTNQTDHPIVEARANMAQIHSAVELLRRVYFLTARKKRKVALVPVDLGELIEKAGGPDRVAELLKEHVED